MRYILARYCVTRTLVPWGFPRLDLDAPEDTPPVKLLAAWLGVFLIGFTGLSVLAWGWIAWLPAAMQVGEDFGPGWRWVAFAAGGAATLAVASGFWRVQDTLSRRLDPNRAPGDSVAADLFCRTCGLFKPARLSADRCPSCGTLLSR